MKVPILKLALLVASCVPSQWFEAPMVRRPVRRPSPRRRQKAPRMIRKWPRISRAGCRPISPSW